MKLQLSFRGEPRGTVTSEGDQVHIETDNEDNRETIAGMVKFYGDNGKLRGDELLNEMARKMRSQWWLATFVDDQAAAPPAP